MPDIRIIQQTDFPRLAVTLDWLLTPTGELDDSQALATAVIVAIGTDRLAEATDILPDLNTTNRRGWWGDVDAEEVWGGWPIGTRLWLLRRDKITDSGARQGATLTRVEDYLKESLQPFVDNKIATHFQVDVERNGRNRIDARVQLFRGPSSIVDIRFQSLWDEIGVTG